MKKKLLAIVLLISIMPFTEGCRHNINTSNPKVVAISTLGDAMNICKSVHDLVQNADKTIDSLQATEPEYYTKAQPLIKKIRDANDVAVRAIVDATNGGTSNWKSAMLSLAGTIKPGDLTTFGFKNPNTQTLVSASIGGLEVILASIPSKIGA